MAMSSSMATAGGSSLSRRRTPTTWGREWAQQGQGPHRLWASMPEEFWMYVYKVQRCPQASNHLWTQCPYAHRGERARRRDPRRFSYLPVACPSYRASQQLPPTCARGARCRYAHGVFELWLHPARFRTRMCEAGMLCPRRICFFAHCLAERRRAAEYDAVVGQLLPPPPVHGSRALAAPADDQVVVDFITRDMAGKLRLCAGGNGSGASSSSSSRRPAANVAVAATTTTTPVLAVLQEEASPDDDEDRVEEGSVAGDYPHLDLIRDMVMS